MKKYHVVGVPTAHNTRGPVSEWRIAAVDGDVLITDNRFPVGRDKDAYLLVADALNREDRKERKRAEREPAKAAGVERAKEMLA